MAYGQQGEATSEQALRSLRILGIEAVQTVPLVPWSHPFVAAEASRSFAGSCFGKTSPTGDGFGLA